MLNMLAELRSFEIRLVAVMRVCETFELKKHCNDGSLKDGFKMP